MLNLLAVTLVDLGIIGILAGLVSLVKPLRFLGIRSRIVITASLVLILAGMFTPAPLQQLTEPRTELDRAMPAFQFSEHHSITVRATPERVYDAIKGVTADEILLFRTLIWIRRFGRPVPESIMNPARSRPLIDVATRTTFAWLADSPREIVVGTVVVAPREVARSVRLPTADQFFALRARDGFALAAMNFAIRPVADGACDVTTETRVLATDPGAARRFGAYWRVIYPGSSLIRYMWLRAIKKRAEAPAAMPRGPPRGISDSSRRGWGPAASGKKLASSPCACN